MGEAIRDYQAQLQMYPNLYLDVHAYGKYETLSSLHQAVSKVAKFVQRLVKMRQDMYSTAEGRAKVKVILLGHSSVILIHLSGEECTPDGRSCIQQDGRNCRRRCHREVRQ